MSKAALPKKKITIEVPSSLHKKFRAKTKKLSTSMNQVLTDHIQSYIKGL